MADRGSSGGQAAFPCDLILSGSALDPPRVRRRAREASRSGDLGRRSRRPGRVRQLAEAAPLDAGRVGATPASYAATRAGAGRLAHDGAAGEGRGRLVAPGRPEGAHCAPRVAAHELTASAAALSEEKSPTGA